MGLNLDKDLSTFQDMNLPALTSQNYCSYTIYFQDTQKGIWVYGKTFESLSDCVKEQRALEKCGAARKSIVIKTEVTTKQTYLWGC